MRALIFLLLITGLLASCGSTSVPSDIIAREKMEVIVWQLMQADEYVTTLVARDSTKKTSTEKMKIYQQVFDLNKTSLDEFKKSYQFYMAHPDITKIMFDSITANAARRRTELYSSTTDSTTIKHIPPHRPGSDTTVKAIVPPSGIIKPATDTSSMKNRMRRLKLYKPKIDSASKHIKKGK